MVSQLNITRFMLHYFIGNKVRLSVIYTTSPGGLK